MSTLDEILAHPTVEVFESTVDLDVEAFERRLRTVESRENRAVAGIVQDDGWFLLARYRGDDRWDRWRLPGSVVGNVTDFEPRLREHLTDLLGDAVAGVEPTQVQKHTARRAGVGSRTGEREARPDDPSLFYVLYEVELHGRPTEVVADASPPENVELGWFDRRPDDVINDGVMDRLFGES